MVRRALRNQNCLSRFLFKVLFSTGEFRWFTFSHFSAFFIQRLDFFVTFFIKKKSNLFVIKNLYKKLTLP